MNSLLLLDNDCLASCLCYISAEDLTFLWISGDKRLQARLVSNGVVNIWNQTCSTHLSLVLPRMLSNFPFLRDIRILADTRLLGAELRELDLSLLPKSVTSIHANFYNTVDTFLSGATATKDAELQPLAQFLPNLRHLKLMSSNCISKIHREWFRHLPPLTRLELDRNNMINDASALSLLPSSITQLNISLNCESQDWSQINLPPILEDLQLYDVSGPEIYLRLPPSLTRLHIVFAIRAVSKFQDVIPAHDWSHLPKGLQILELGAVPQLTREMLQSINPDLVRLVLWVLIDIPLELMEFIPKRRLSILWLTMDAKPEDPASTIGEREHSAKFKSLCSVLRNLPSSVEFLDLSIPWRDWPCSLLEHIPPHIKRIEGYSGKMSTSLLPMLPRNLTFPHLDLEAVVDSDIDTIPTWVEYLSIDQSYISCRPLRRKKLPDLDPLKLLPDGFVQSRLPDEGPKTDESSGEVLLAQRALMFTKLTKITVNMKTQFEVPCHLMPSLTELEIESNISLDPLPTPNFLKILTIQTRRIKWSQTELFNFVSALPPSLDTLHFQSTRADPLCLSLLPRNLRFVHISDLERGVTETDFEKLPPHLTTLELPGAPHELESSSVALLPRTLTTLQIVGQDIFSTSQLKPKHLFRLFINVIHVDSENIIKRLQERYPSAKHS